MDVKQEQDIFDYPEGLIKTEPAVFEQTDQSDYWYPEETVSANVQICPPETIKQELENTSDVKKIDIKQECNVYTQQKTESDLSELLTSYCDLPTLKIESESTADLGDEHDSKKSLENTAKSVLKKKKYACPICQKKTICHHRMFEDSDSEHILSPDESKTSEQLIETHLKPMANKKKDVEENLQAVEIKDNSYISDNTENQFVEQTSIDMNSEKDQSCSDVVNSPTKEHSIKKKLPRIRRKHKCQFCHLKLLNFSRHLERNHSDEPKVQQLLSLDKNSIERKKYIDKLRQEGDFYSSKIIPVVTKHNNDYNDHIPCTFCMGYFAPKNLRKHAKKCYHNPNPTTKFMAQIEGQNLMIGNFKPNDPLVKAGVFKILRADAISLTAKKDKLITEVARRYLKSNKKKKMLVVKRQMRRLSRLLISVRKNLNEKNISMIDALKPSNFKILIEATKEIAEYDETSRTYKSPTLAFQMGSLIKNAVSAAVSMEVRKKNCNKKKLEKLSSLTALVKTDWVNEISSGVIKNVNEKRIKKLSLITAAEDIKKFETYLMNTIKRSRSSLLKNPKNETAYGNMLEGLFCRLLIFNKREVGELQKITLSEYLKNVDDESEFQKLSITEKIICPNLKKIVIKGKRGRGVPVLFDKKSQDAFDVLIELRDNFGLQDNLYLFGVPDSQSSIRGYNVIRKHATIALGCPNKADMLTATRFREHLSIIAQIFSMEKNDLKQLATFMGHEKDSHLSWYPLPNNIYKTAKLSKLLMLGKKNNFEKFKGKSLDEIELDDFIEETKEVDDDVKLQCTEPPPPVKKKRILVPWTAKQKKLAEERFVKNIKKKIPPRKKEVEELIKQYPDVFRNKTWPVIKVYICNIYNKK